MFTRYISLPLLSVDRLLSGCVLVILPVRNSEQEMTELFVFDLEQDVIRLLGAETRQGYDELSRTL